MRLGNKSQGLRGSERWGRPASAAAVINLSFPHVEPFVLLGLWVLMREGGVTGKRRVQERREESRVAEGNRVICPHPAPKSSEALGRVPGRTRRGSRTSLLGNQS